MKKSIIFNMLYVASCLLASAQALAVTSFDPSKLPVGTAPRPAVTSQFVGSGNEYQFFAWHVADKYKGNLDVYKLNAAGRVTGDPLWRASTTDLPGPPVVTVTGSLDGQPSRNIVTLKAGAKVAFNATNFSTTTSLGATAAQATDVINFLRGDRTKEKTTANPTGIFRERDALLGDIMHSSPIFVGAPRGGDGTASFSAFRNANANRARRVYVGANDGMVHAFDAGTYDTATGKFPDVGTGKEVFAYIPSMLIPRLKALSDPAYTHQYYVDGALAVGDVKFSTDSQWHTVLVGTLGAGGKGMFALDVTNPDAATEGDAANKILWEITPSSPGFADMGDTFSEPVLAKLNNGQYAIVVGNGYNSSSGKAMLYLINPATGALITSAPIQAGTSTASGLASPGVYDNDGNGTIDYVYSGDIEGNLWRFNLNSSNPADWQAAGGVSIPFGGNGQPIVGAPAILPHPQGGLMINFATGAYFSDGDGSLKWDIDYGSVQNYAYGVWDGADTSLPMQSQDITRQTYSGATPAVEVMTSTANPVNYAAPATPLHKGWKAKLPLGASVPSNGAYVANGRFTFTTSNPAGLDTANRGNWLVQLDYLTGGPSKIIYDLNLDGYYNDTDRTTSSVTSANNIPVGLYLSGDIISQPTYSSLGPKLDKVLYTAYEPGVPPTPYVCPAPCEPGLRGGHFDFDSYRILGGSKDKHVHQYDDKYDATGVNMLNNTKEPAFDLDDPIYGNLVRANDLIPANKFFIIVANGDLSSMASIRINSDVYLAPDYPNVINDLSKRKTYKLADMTNLSIELPRDALEKRGLHPTVTGCVNGAGSVQAVPGDATPRMVGGTAGKLKTWRNGALTIQILKHDTPASMIRMNVAGQPQKGYVLTNSAFLLREYTIFWHASVSCYETASWTATPPLDNSATAPSGVATNDPGNGNNPFIVSIASVTQATPPSGFAAVSGAASYTVTTTIYNDNTRIITVIAKNAAGEVLGSTSSVGTVSSGGGGLGGGGSPESLNTSETPKTVKGKVTGRVNWSEKFKSK